jgi:hypothetical protein
MTLDPRTLRPPFIPWEDCRYAAETIRDKHWPERTIPVDVEKIALRMGVKIRLLTGLAELGSEAQLTGNLEEILVDTKLYSLDAYENRVRFSIAHELGHLVLHSGIYAGSSFGSVQEWVEFKALMPEDTYTWIEQHAYEFAGRILVPLEELRIRLDECVKKLPSQINIESAKGNFCTYISKFFGVSDSVIYRRLDREGLWPPC